MKRNLFLLIAVAAALSACSKTETIGTQDKAIQFTSAYIGNAVESKAVNMINRPTSTSLSFMAVTTTI